MTIEKLISLMNIKSVPFLIQPDTIRESYQLPIYATAQGVCYWREESIWSLGMDEESEAETDRIRQEIKDQIPGLYDGRELDKYVAVYEILSAVKEYRGEEGDIEIRSLAGYVELINIVIAEELDFGQIPDMAELRGIISSDQLYRQMLFEVCEVDCAKEGYLAGDDVHRRNYCFGNVEYHEKPDKVGVLIYEDCVEVICTREPRVRFRHMLKSEKKLSSEEKIIQALDFWRSAYRN